MFTSPPGQLCPLKQMFIPGKAKLCNPWSLKIGHCFTLPWTRIVYLGAELSVWQWCSQVGSGWETVLCVFETADFNFRNYHKIWTTVMRLFPIFILEGQFWEVMVRDSPYVMNSKSELLFMKPQLWARDICEVAWLQTLSAHSGAKQEAVRRPFLAKDVWWS